MFAGGVLFLACVPTVELLEAHAAVYDAVAPLARNPWSYYSPGVWTPHMTISYGLNEDQIARALRAGVVPSPDGGSLDHSRCRGQRHRGEVALTCLGPAVEALCERSPAKVQTIPVYKDIFVQVSPPSRVSYTEPTPSKGRPAMAGA